MGCRLSREQGDWNQEPISDFIHSVKFRENEGQKAVQIFTLTNLPKGQSEFMHTVSWIFVRFMIGAVAAFLNNLDFKKRLKS